MNLQKYFNKIYCINLEFRKDRWAECVLEFEKWEISEQVIKFPAINGSYIQNNYPVSNGELGLILTHEQILQDAIDKNYESILVIEDDVEFINKFSNLKEYIEALPLDWEILWLGANHNIHCGNQLKLINDKIIKCRKAFATHCIAFNNRIYPTALKLIKNKEKPVDVYYSELQQTHNCYAFHPSLAIQRPSYSDIQKQHQDNRWLF